jgi:hypothetical protein
MTDILALEGAISVWNTTTPQGDKIVCLRVDTQEGEIATALLDGIDVRSLVDLLTRAEEKLR